MRGGLDHTPRVARGTNGPWPTGKRDENVVATARTPTCIENSLMGTLMTMEADIRESLRLIGKRPHCPSRRVVPCLYSREHGQGPERIVPPLTGNPLNGPFPFRAGYRSCLASGGHGFPCGCTHPHSREGAHRFGLPPSACCQGVRPAYEQGACTRRHGAYPLPAQGAILECGVTPTCV